MNLASLAIKQALCGDLEAAAKTNQEILKEDKENIEALNRLATAFLHLGKKNKAQTIYRRVLRLDRFNPIAKRNLEKIKNFSLKKKGNSPANPDFNFLEEPGKTQLITLVCPGEKKTLAQLAVSEVLKFVTRGRGICLYSQNKEYIGRLPDDLSRRLIWLLNRGNHYQACIRGVDINRVTVFLKEVKQVKINRNYISFPDSLNDNYSSLFS